MIEGSLRGICESFAAQWRDSELFHSRLAIQIANKHKCDNLDRSEASRDTKRIPNPCLLVSASFSDRRDASQNCSADTTQSRSQQCANLIEIGSCLPDAQSR